MSATKHNVNTPNDETHLQGLLTSRRISVLNFWATWAEQCKDMNEVFAELSRKYPALQFIGIEAENFPDVSETYEVAAVPTFVVVKDTKVVGRIEGANASGLTSLVEKYASSFADEQHAVPAATHDLNTRLKALINSHPVMIFIKGTPSTPRCGFSRQAIELLAESGVKYGSFNILADDEVRQGLKQLSDWPTFPQIYVNGELIGGVDILKEMVSSGEFQQMAPKEESLEERLKRLINKSPVVLFMKGNPEVPRCGFSRQITQLLTEQGVKYDTFDILEDEEVRQGLKSFSNWPTYPQLYVNGELVGGLDIVRELVQQGELQAVIEG
ncbi:Glutaredoxin 3 [Gaertneriomyces sp. JEL0708]|nr:Glutaredoxin 3 [Gaertneriomyces sp. JEL0708]